MKQGDYMGANDLFEAARGLKESEANERVDKHELELDYEKECIIEQSLQAELSTAERELASCELPTDEDREDGDYKDENRAEELEREISRLESDIQISKEKQKSLQSKILIKEKIIEEIMANERSLLVHITTNIGIQSQNINELNIDVGECFNWILQETAVLIERELNTLESARNLLESDVGTIVPEVGRYLKTNYHSVNASRSYNKSFIPTIVRAALLGFTGQELGMVLTLLMPFFKPALLDMVSDPKDKGTLRQAIRNFAILFPFNAFAFFSDNITIDTSNYIPEPSYWDRTWQNVVFGNYSNMKPTEASIAINIAASFTNLDIPMDIRDLTYDFQHYDTVSKLQFGLDIVGAIPFVGIFKKIGSLSQAAEVVSSVDDPVKYFIKNSDDAITYFGKTSDDVITVFGKYSDDAITYFGKNYDDAITVFGKNIGNGDAGAMKIKNCDDIVGAVAKHGDNAVDAVVTRGKHLDDPLDVLSQSSKGVIYVTENEVTSTGKILHGTAFKPTDYADFTDTMKSRWYHSTIKNMFGKPDFQASWFHHLAKHGEWRSLKQYTDEATDFFNQFCDIGIKTKLMDDTEGLKIIKEFDVGNGFKRSVGGYWKPDGRLVTYWNKILKGKVK